MRGFRCVPLFLKYAPELAELSSFERDLLFSALLAQDDRHCLPHDAATLRSEVFPTRPFVGLAAIAAARDKLLARGVFLHRTTQRRTWMEIAPEYRHTEGRIETSFADETLPPAQLEMPLGPIGAMRPSARTRNRSRVEPEKNKDVVVVPLKSTEPPHSRARTGNDNDDTCVVLEQQARALGANLTSEDRLWRRKCEQKGWSQDRAGWELWLTRLLERKPKPAATAAGARPVETEPHGWREFIALHYPTANVERSYHAALTLHRSVIAEFEHWQRRGAQATG
jgi:hypothetical protein